MPESTPESGPLDAQQQDERPCRDSKQGTEPFPRSDGAPPPEVDGKPWTFMPWSAKPAERLYGRRFPRVASSADSTAGRPHSGHAGERFARPVWNLEIEGAHEFVANGILVHNCDALRYLLATRPLAAPVAPRKTGQTIDARFHQMMRKLDKRRGPSWT